MGREKEISNRRGERLRRMESSHWRQTKGKERFGGPLKKGNGFDDKRALAKGEGGVAAEWMQSQNGKK